MGRAIDGEGVAKAMLAEHSLELISLKKIQSLWAGYGHICQVTVRASSDAVAARIRKTYGGDISVLDADGNETFPLILKLISPPVASELEDEGHLRKIFSYEVEQNFYRSIIPKLGGDLPVARCIAAVRGSSGSGSDKSGGLTAILMTDLRLKYPVAGEKRAVLNEKQVHSALRWLSDFHRRSWRVLPIPLEELLQPPIQEAERRSRCSNATTSTTSGKSSVWLNGGYTYLATRRTEYTSLAADATSEWSTALCTPLSSSGCPIAEMVARVLTPRGRECETLIHGDVKSENLFITKSGSEVAFYDFQYVGLGLGVCDLAKLFTCSVPVHMLTEDDSSNELSMDVRERQLLELYRENLLVGTDKVYDWNTFVRHWEAALVDWLRFQASWGFWGNTEWLEARVRSILKDEKWINWLEEEQNHIDKNDRWPLPN